jgi:hypothetical protein
MSIIRAAIRALGSPFRAFSSSPRPFKILGVQQIAIGGESKVVMLRHLACPPCFGLFCFVLMFLPLKQAMQKLWVDMFGLEKTGTFRRALAEAL